MSINLNQLVQGALTESVLQQIAGRIGCAPESAQRVVALCGPALIGSMMNKASSLEGARQLFTAIMAPTTNAHIADELPHFVTHDDGFKTLVDTGARADQAIASHDGLNLLAERVSEYTGVAASATRTLTGVVSATIFGVLKRYFSQHQGHAGQLPSLLGHQLPVVRANLTDSFAQALGLGAVGAFLAGVASRLKAVSAHLEHPATHEAAEFPLQVETPAPVQQSETSENACRKKWWWLALAAALALLAILLGRGCSTGKPQIDTSAAKSEAASGAITDNASEASDASAASAASAASVMPAASAADQASAPVAAPSGKDSTMSFLVDPAGVPTLTATVGSEQEKQRVLDMLAVKLGMDKFHANITVDPDTKPAAWLGKLDGLLPVMALPGAQVRVEGEKVDLSGRAADAKLGWLDKLKAFFGDGWTIGATADQTASADQPATATAGACVSDGVAKKLNLRPVKFGFASNTPPRAALAELAKSAKVLSDCNAAGTPIKLQINGFSDNVGNSALNVGLSERRAEAVRAYLIKQGVPADTLTVKGFGKENPIADNKTAAGRSANRRIEFTQLS